MHLRKIRHNEGQNLKDLLSKLQPDINYEEKCLAQGQSGTREKFNSLIKTNSILRDQHDMI